MAFSLQRDVKLVELPRRVQNDGELVVFEERSGLPFAVTRVFTVSAGDGSVRGRHAHKQCWQVLICVAGAISVECDDGQTSRSYTLDRTNLALVVPPSIWASETYRGARSTLMVLCDQPYDESDYIRDYSEFVSWRRKHAGQ